MFGTKHNGTDGIAAAEMLKSFCYWQKLNNPDEPSPEHHDAALLLTRSVYKDKFVVYTRDDNEHQRKDERMGKEKQNKRECERERERER